MVTRVNNAQSNPLTICIIAGEASGDNLGAGLMDGIREAAPDAIFIGVGGPAMQAKGLDSIFPMSDLSVMGIAEVLPKLRALLTRIKETASFIQTKRPDVVVTIDSPDFNFRVAKRLLGEGIPLVHYVAPSVWAWRPKRAKKIAGIYHHLLTLLPFEPPYFEAEGLPSTFVGHPVVIGGVDKGDAEAFRSSHNIAPKAPLLCLLPGSRSSEISRLLPVFLQTLKQLRKHMPDLHAVFPTIPHLISEVRAALHGLDNVSIVSDERGKIDSFSASTAALAASGTVALELAMAGVPTVIGYKVSPMSAFLARRLVNLEFYSLPNILLGREVMPEILQEDCTADNLVSRLYPLLSDNAARKDQLNAFNLVRAKLTPTTATPNGLAAEAVIGTINKAQA